MMSAQFASTVLLKRDEVPSFERYPFSLPAIRNLDVLELHPKVTFFIGENGSGKSTLLEGIAVALGFNPEGGTKNFSFDTFASHSELHEHLRIYRGRIQPRNGFFLRAESFYNVATHIEKLDSEPSPPGVYSPPVIESYGGVSLHNQSHGESFLTLMMNRFGPDGIYILDEPEAALSPLRQLSIISLIHDLAEANCQFIIATHSPIIMAYPNAKIYQFSANGIDQIDYFETEHYQVTRDFLTNPKRMLKVLMERS